MRERLDNFLLGTLWVLACMLGSCFWFKTIYGFNILSGAHWRYLGQMQATQTTIKPTFYISLIVIASVLIYGLYLIIRPRFKHIRLPKIHKPTAPASQQKTVAQPVATTNQQQPVAQQPNTPTATPVPQAPTNGLVRPPRLNIPMSNHVQTTAPFTAPITAPVSAPQATTTTQPTESPEMREIFENAGYIVKKAPQISGLQLSLFAVGSNENIWIGATGIETETMANIIDTINQVFLDTLDDVEIGINGFVISAQDADTPTNKNIFTFDSIETLRQYINEHPNPPVRDEDAENFEAFSDYITTVIDYIGKL